MKTKIRNTYPFALFFFLILVLLFGAYHYLVLVPFCRLYARMRGVMERLDTFDLWISDRLAHYWRQL